MVSKVQSNPNHLILGLLAQDPQLTWMERKLSKVNLSPVNDAVNVLKNPSKAKGSTHALVAKLNELAIGRFAGTAYGSALKAASARLLEMSGQMGIATIKELPAEQAPGKVVDQAQGIFGRFKKPVKVESEGTKLNRQVVADLQQAYSRYEELLANTPSFLWNHPEYKNTEAFKNMCKQQLEETYVQIRDSEYADANSIAWCSKKRPDDHLAAFSEARIALKSSRNLKNYKNAYEAAFPKYKDAVAISYGDDPQVKIMHAAYDNMKKRIDAKVALQSVIAVSRNLQTALSNADEAQKAEMKRNGIARYFRPGAQFEDVLNRELEARINDIKEVLNKVLPKLIKDEEQILAWTEKHPDVVEARFLRQDTLLPEVSGEMNKIVNILKMRSDIEVIGRNFTQEAFEHYTEEARRVGNKGVEIDLQVRGL